MIDFDNLALAPCVDVFGQQAVYLPAAGAPLRLVGIFNRFSTEEKFDDSKGVMVNVTYPTLAIRIVDLMGRAEPCQNETVEVGGEVWAIADATPDGMGQLLLRLKKVRT